MKILVKFKPEINAQDKFGRNALFLCLLITISKMLRVCNCLTDSGANVNCEGIDKSTPLMAAIQRDHLQIVQILIRYKANVYSG